MEGLQKEWRASDAMPWEEDNNTDTISDMLCCLVLRYDDVMAYCYKRQKELYEPLGVYLSRVFKTQEKMYDFSLSGEIDETIEVDEEELNRYYEKYYLLTVAELEEAQKNERLSL